MLKRKFGSIIIITFVAVIFLTIAAGCGKKDSPNSYVKMELGQINAEKISLDLGEATVEENNLSEIKLHFVVDSNNIVLAVDGLNNNSKGLIVDLSLNGKKLNEAIEIILNESVAIGILSNIKIDDAKDAVNISIYSDNKKLQKKQQEKIGKFINGWKADNKIEVKVDNDINIKAIQKIVKEYNPQLTEVTINQMTEKELMNQVQVNVSENSTFVDVDLQNSFIKYKTLVKVDKDKVLVDVDGDIKNYVSKYLDLKESIVNTQIKLQRMLDETKAAIEDKYEEKKGDIDLKYERYLQSRNELIKVLENNSSTEKEIKDAQHKYELAKVDYNFSVKVFETFNQTELEVVTVAYSVAIQTLKTAEKALDAFINELPEEVSVKVRVSVDKNIVEVSANVHSNYINNEKNKQQIEDARKNVIAKKKQIKKNIAS